MSTTKPSILSQRIDDAIENETTEFNKLRDLSYVPPHIWTPIKTICTMANEAAIPDLRVFLFTLQLWNEHLPTLYLYCTQGVKNLELERDYKGKIVYNTSLDAYSNTNRQEMERQSSRMGLKNRFHDFTVEKCNLLDWVFQQLTPKQKEYGVVFCDADICWLGPLPNVDQRCQIGLSMHQINPIDEQRYGIYNAGFFWFRHQQTVDRWREACKTSRFFEQAALEDLTNGLVPWQIDAFPTTVNYGWWRLYQGKQRSDHLASLWGLKRDPEEKYSGIVIEGEPLVCIHTHWLTNDAMTNSFNAFVVGRLQYLMKQKKVMMFLKYLARLGSQVASDALRAKKK